MRLARSLADAPRTNALVLLGFGTLAVLLVRLALFDVRNPRDGFHGHGYCYLWDTDLVTAHAVSDGLIAVSYVAIAGTLVHLVRRTREGLPYSWMFVAFGFFIVACGATHVMDVWTLWTPMFWLSADVKMITAVASLATAVMLPPLVPRVLALVEEARVSEERRDALARAAAELEARVLERTSELNASLHREQALRVAAEAASRAKEEFLATVSHELRTPLNAILGWSEVLQRTGLVTSQTARGIAAIARNARAQARVVEDLLDVSRITSGKLTLDLAPVTLEQVVRTALDVVRPAADAKQIEVSFDAGTEPLVVLGDAARLQQVAWNLLSNAVKFTPAAGRIDVRLERSHDHGCLVVEDTGIGIAPEFLPYLFDRFTQADASTTRQYAGLGLGLAIARHLVELHGGWIKVKSAGPGLGATFRVEVPLARTGAAPVDGTTPDVSLSHVRLKGCHVLVVDDDAESRDVAAAIIGAAGGTAVFAASAAEGLDYAASGAFDAVICDIGMPHEDGYTFVRRLRASGRPPMRAVAAIALTGYAGPDDVRRALDAGFDLHLAKPIAPDALVEALAGFFPRQPRL